MQQNNQNQVALPPAINAFAGLKDLNPVTALMVDYFSKRERTARKTILTRFVHELEAEYKCRVDWDQMVAGFKFLNDVKAGALVTGKTADKHRFEWGLSLIDVAKAAKGEIGPESVRAAPTGKTRVVYPVGYTPKRKNKNSVRAKRSGVKGRIKGGKNAMPTKVRQFANNVVSTAVARVAAVPANNVGPGVEVMVIEGGSVRRYEVMADKVQGFNAVLPAFAVAK